MAASREDISEWFDRGIAEGKDFLIVVCDTYDWEDYPVIVAESEFAVEYKKHNGQNMQKIMEVYNLHKPKAEQMNQHRCFEMPAVSTEVSQ